jgi:hypothetical protein
LVIKFLLGIFFFSVLGIIFLRPQKNPILSLN